MRSAILVALLTISVSSVRADQFENAHPATPIDALLLAADMGALDILEGDLAGRGLLLQAMPRNAHRRDTIVPN